MPSDLDAMSRHVEALFTHDERGRLRRVNEPNGAIAPRLFLGRTTDGPVWRFRFDLPHDLAEQLEVLCLNEPTDDLRQAPIHFAEYRRLLETHSPVEKAWMGPAYQFPDAIARSSAEAIVVTDENADALTGSFDEWIPDVPRSQPFLALLHEGYAVSICCSVRITGASHEAGVETLQAYRGNGYASGVVAEWARRVRSLGCAPLYSTSWTNVASQRVATKLGLRFYGSDCHVT